MKTQRIKLPRLFWLLVFNLALIGIIFAIAPQQAPVTLYKLSLVTLAGLVGYWLDRAIFPYARPDQYLIEACGHIKPAQCLELVFAVAMFRRAIIVGCAMLAMGLGA